MMTSPNTHDSSMASTEVSSLLHGLSGPPGASEFVELLPVFGYSVH